MSDQFIGEIRQVAFNFVPKGWAACDGALLPIAQNTALFSLLGTFYGGDGKTTFALPDLRERLPLQVGDGPGLSSRYLGERGGSAQVSLQPAQMPPHNHQLMATASAEQKAPAGDSTLATVPGNGLAYRLPNATAPVLMDESAMDLQGNGQAHNNLPPVLATMFIIALQGIYPPRS